ncbi:MAG: HesA/MoeB/ThiF family protein [Oscillospiraceae bacterium]|nr:HesA/MoeB/ThiF family protein [Oscillospiraceae bacterium]
MNGDERERYARQLMLPELNTPGQERLQAARVLLIGAGGLASPAALYLAAAGVGVVGLADGDSVERSNLQRQILHATPDLGRFKVESARETLEKLNPHVAVPIHRLYATPETIAPLIAGYDFVLDCTDNYDSKFLINDACVRAEKAFCHAGISGFRGQLMTWLPGGAPCFRCVFGQPPPDAPRPGVMGAAVGVIGSLQAMEAIKYIAGIGTLCVGGLLTYDALSGEFRRISLPRDASCAACGA